MAIIGDAVLSRLLIIFLSTYGAYPEYYLHRSYHPLHCRSNAISINQHVQPENTENYHIVKPLWRRRHKRHQIGVPEHRHRC